jgi:hypothetical protein
VVHRHNLREVIARVCRLLTAAADLEATAIGGKGLGTQTAPALPEPEDVELTLSGDSEELSQQKA